MQENIQMAASEKTLWSVGDLVQLKSGSPWMTVSQVSGEGCPTNGVRAQWFGGPISNVYAGPHGDELREGPFPSASLKGQAPPQPMSPMGVGQPCSIEELQNNTGC